MPGSVSKHGNPRLRAALVELVWRMVRFQPNYGPSKSGSGSWPMELTVVWHGNIVRG
jgi:hypothetical protein